MVNIRFFFLIFFLIWANISNSSLSDLFYNTQNSDGSFGVLQSDQYGRVKVTLSPIVDELNSFDDPLESMETRVGACSERKSTALAMSLNSDKDHQIIARFSNTLANCLAGIFDSNVPKFFYAGQVNVPKPLEIYRHYYRIDVTNISGENSSFTRFQVSQGEFSQPISTLDSNIQTDFDATVTRSIIAVQKPNGLYQNVQGDNDGNLNVNIPSERFGSKVLSGDRNIFGSISVQTPLSDFDVNFTDNLPLNLISTNITGSGDISVANSKLSVKTSSASSTANAYSNTAIRYRPGKESAFVFTALWPIPPTTDGIARIGAMENSIDNNMLAIGYNGNQFGIWHINNGSINFVSQFNFSEDTLQGQAGSGFTRNKIAEAIDPMKGNIYRITYGWLGFAPPSFEVLSPDGNWVVFHKIKYPNTSNVPSLSNPTLNLKAQVISNNDSGNIELSTSSWTAGHYGLEKDNIIASSNTSSDPLLANQTFTGKEIELLDITEIEVSVYSDQDSAENGMNFEYSQDGSSWFSVAGGFNYKANTLRTFHFGNSARFFRVRYVNGSVNQGLFTILTKKLSKQSKTTITRLDRNETVDKSAEVVKSAIIGLDDQNDIFKIVRVSPSGSFQVAITDRPSEVRDRIHVDKNITRTALSGTPTVIHTVTGGKIFYLTSIIVNFLNDSTSVGELRIRDSGTVKIPLIGTSRSIGSPAAGVVASPPLPEPIPFNTNLEVLSISGTIEATITIVGYEEMI